MLYGYRQFNCIHKKDGIYKDIPKDVETRFDPSSFEFNRPLPKGNNKKVIDAMIDELGGKIMKDLVGLREKTYSYLIEDGSQDKKTKDTKQCVKKKKKS